MPSVIKPYSRSSRGRFQAKPSGRLAMPAVGMESEFNIYLDGKEIVPEAYWKHPSAFIDAPMLKREKTSGHVPTGGAVYFDRGVIEVVTPPFELAPGCATRVGTRNGAACGDFIPGSTFLNSTASAAFGATMRGQSYRFFTCRAQ